jgi:hypothetical protein
MKKIIAITTTAFVLFSCNNNKTSTASYEALKQDSIKFFPVTSFINGQYKSIDAAQVTPMLVITANNKTDSLWLKKEEVAAYLTPFKSIEINTDNLTNLYQETRFKDESVNAITFTYSPLPALPDTASLRKWDVYIHPENGEVKKVFIVQQYTEAGQNYTRQLTWEANRSARITTISNMPDGNRKVLKDVKIVWMF